MNMQNIVAEEREKTKTASCMHPDEVSKLNGLLASGHLRDTPTTS